MFTVEQRFKQQLKNCLNNQALGWRSVKYRKLQYVYTPGEQDGMIYYIETGLVKLILPSSEGKKCLVSNLNGRGYFWRVVSFRSDCTA